MHVSSSGCSGGRRADLLRARQWRRLRHGECGKLFVPFQRLHRLRSSRVPASDSRRFSASSTGTAAASGRRVRLAKARRSTLRSRYESREVGLSPRSPTMPGCHAVGLRRLRPTYGTSSADRRCARREFRPRRRRVRTSRSRGQCIRPPSTPGIAHTPGACRAAALRPELRSSRRPTALPMKSSVIVAVTQRMRPPLATRAVHPIATSTSVAIAPPWTISCRLQCRSSTSMPSVNCGSLRRQ